MNQRVKQFCYFLLIVAFAVNIPISAKTNTATVATFASILKQAHNGDRIKLKKGHYYGNFVINKSITLQCSPGTILDGKGKGNTLTVLQKMSPFQAAELLTGDIV